MKLVKAIAGFALAMGLMMQAAPASANWELTVLEWDPGTPVVSGWGSNICPEMYHDETTPLHDPGYSGDAAFTFTGQAVLQTWNPTSPPDNCAGYMTASGAVWNGLDPDPMSGMSDQVNATYQITAAMHAVFEWAGSGCPTQKWYLIGAVDVEADAEISVNIGWGDAYAGSNAEGWPMALADVYWVWDGNETDSDWIYEPGILLDDNGDGPNYSCVLEATTPNVSAGGGWYLNGYDNYPGWGAGSSFAGVSMWCDTTPP